MNTTLLSRACAMLPLVLLLPTGRASAAPVPADPQALALLQKVQTATRNTHSLTADFVTITRYKTPKSEYRRIGSIKMMKPNYLRERIWITHKDEATSQWKKQNLSMANASDGKNLWHISYSGEYRKNPADANGHNTGSGSVPTYDFFDVAQSPFSQVQQQQAKGQLLALTDAGVQVWEGHSYQVIDWKYVLDYPFLDDVRKTLPRGIVTEEDRLFIGKDNFVYKEEDVCNAGWSGERALRNVRVNAPLTAASFKFTLPPGAHLPAPPPALLANGTPAPDFAATAPDGSTVHLSDYKGKTVVLDFWSTWCGPCQMSMPHLEKVYQAVKDKNVAVLSICVFDEKPAYDKWVTAKKDTYHFPTAFDPAGRGDKSIAFRLYHVSVIPTQYVINKDGKIAASTVGYDEKGTELEDALKKQGTEIVAAAKP